jgi:2-polyprenyl-3-methyl-5-hydroxy-6-metoxy-1,4-benzoquinol methylase
MTLSSRGPSRSVDYVLERSDHELQRLANQARLVDPITRHFLEEAGIGTGMRVLDVVSGAGDVAILAANLVGPSGEIVGADTAAAAVKAAESNAKAQAVTNVSFRQCDPAEADLEGPFDAIVGPYVLLFQPDPAAALRKLARHLKPGGVVVFHELDMDGARSFPRVPTYDQCCNWITQTARDTGVDPNMGAKLDAAFVAAQLPPPVLQMQAVIGAGPGWIEVAHLVTDVVRTFRPTMERLIATSTEVDIDNLADRIMTESASGSVLVGRSEVGAWTRA